MDEYYEDDINEPLRLTEGLAIKKLIELGQAEFTLEAPAVDPFESEEQTNIEKAYNFEEYQDLINFDCISLDPDKKDDSASPFLLLEENMEDVTSDGGIKKKIKEIGHGAKAPGKALVYCHYSCYLEFSEVPFDASYLRSKKPFRFQLGNGGVYEGFDIAVSSMMEGEKSQFLIQPKYAFGEMGCLPRIPPNATILADIHLIKVVDCGALCEAEKEMDETNPKKKFEIALKKAKSYHLLGNDAFANKNLPTAISHYRRADAAIKGCSLLDDQEEETYRSLLMKICTNLAICYTDPKVKLPKKAVLACSDAAIIDKERAERNVKLQFNWGKALMQIGDFDAAAVHLKKAIQLDPKNKDIIRVLAELEDRKKKHLEYEKEVYGKAFGFRAPVKTQEDKSSDKDSRVTPGFREKTRGQLNEFFKSKNSRLELPVGLSLDEKSIVKDVCKELGLNYQDVQRHGMEPRAFILK